MSRFRFLKIFWPAAVVVAFLVVGLLGVSFALAAATLVGVLHIIVDSFHELRQRQYSLDYIAFVALVVSLASGQYLAGAVVALMFTGGRGLEAFASERAYAALRSLGEAIPKRVTVWRDGVYKEIALQDVRHGEQILVKSHELVPLDGTLVSTAGAFNLSNLTGEALPAEFQKGTLVKSGAINVGDIIELRVVGDFSSSTYHKIVQLVDDARAHPARIVRLSERANIYFTVITFVFVVLAYLIDSSVTQLLAVLVIATPCPLIIAAPVAFLGGMSRAAQAGIIVRRPAAFEGLERVNMIFFDKTGTLTVGEPALSAITPRENISETEALRIAAAIEINSLHPLARSLVYQATKRGIVFPVATEVTETIGQGISGVVNEKRYHIAGCAHTDHGIALELRHDEQVLAHFYFNDTLKTGAANFLKKLLRRGVHAEIITGDTKENAAAVFRDVPVTIQAGVSPEEKYRRVEQAHVAGQTVVMIGDGLNDAPALARADVGVVFSGTENGASITAADVVILDHHIEKIAELFAAARRTVWVARQSIYGGIALSAIGMAFAAFGFIPPVTGALLQEGIDIVVILNALRALNAEF